MGEIEVAGEKIRLNFWKQMTPPFLVNKTSFQLFEFISKSKEQELITEYQQGTTDKLKTLNKEINDLNTIINSKTLEEVEYKTILENNKKVLEIDLEALEAIYELVETVNQLEAQYNKVEELVKEKEVESSLLNSKVKEVTFFQVEGEKMLQTLTNFNKLLDHYKSSVERKELFELTVKENKKRIVEKETQISSLKTLLDNLENINKQLTDYNKYLTKFKNSQVDELSYLVEIKQIQEELKLAEEELSTFKVCPLCGSGIEHTH